MVVDQYRNILKEDNRKKQLIDETWDQLSETAGKLFPSDPTTDKAVEIGSFVSKRGRPKKMRAVNVKEEGKSKKRIVEVVMESDGKKGEGRAKVRKEKDGERMRVPQESPLKRKRRAAKK
jgi:hypothetical protein